MTPPTIVDFPGKDVLYVEAAELPEGVPKAFQELESHVASLRGCESIPSRRRDGRYASPGFVGIPCRRAQLWLRASFLPGSHLDRRARSGDQFTASEIATSRFLTQTTPASRSAPIRSSS